METGTKLPITIREATAREVSLIFSSWLKSLKSGSYIMKRVRDSIYFPKQHRRIEKIIADPNTVLLVAQQEDDVDQVFGYICATKKVHNDQTYLYIHYVYVKAPFRSKTIANLLLNSLPGYNKDMPCFITEYTFVMEKIMPKLKLLLDPFYFDKE